MLLMVWWGRSALPFIDEAYPPVVSTIILWSKKSFMKSADWSISPPSSTSNTENF